MLSETISRLSHRSLLNADRGHYLTFIWGVEDTNWQFWQLCRPNNELVNGDVPGLTEDESNRELQLFWRETHVKVEIVSMQWYHRAPSLPPNIGCTVAEQFHHEWRHIDTMELSCSVTLNSINKSQQQRLSPVVTMSMWYVEVGGLWMNLAVKSFIEKFCAASCDWIPVQLHLPLPEQHSHVVLGLNWTYVLWKSLCRLTVVFLFHSISLTMHSRWNWWSCGPPERPSRALKTPDLPELTPQHE